MSKPHASQEPETQESDRCEHLWVATFSQGSTRKRRCMDCGSDVTRKPPGKTEERPRE